MWGTLKIKSVVGWESFLPVSQMFYYLYPAITSQCTGPCHSSVHTITAEQGRRSGAGGVALRQGGQFCRKLAFLERQVGLGHVCAVAVPASLDPKCLLNIFSLVSAGGFFCFAFKMFSSYHACVVGMGNGNIAGKLDVAIILLPKQGEVMEWLAAFQFTFEI